MCGTWQWQSKQMAVLLVLCVGKNWAMHVISGREHMGAISTHLVHGASPRRWRLSERSSIKVCALHISFSNPCRQFKNGHPLPLLQRRKIGLGGVSYVDKDQW